MLEPGALLHDRYRLHERIAAGGMGEVWRGTDDLLGRTVAVKLLHRRLVDDAGFGARFRGEARAMASLHHPGVADVYDYGETAVPGDDDRAVYIVMAWVQGQPLSERIAAAGRLDAATTASVVAQTARALQAVHEAGVVHRDVKPANLVVEPDGHVVLIDFGVAVTEDAAPLTAVNEVVGTALYMAPEQISKQKITPATDIYALGAVAYHCLAGHPPFPGDNALTVALQHLDAEPPPLPGDTDPGLRAVVARAMAKDPADRFPTAAAMADAARTGADSAATVVTPAAVVDPSPTEPTQPTRAGDTLVGPLAGPLAGAGIAAGAAGAGSGFAAGAAPVGAPVGARRSVRPARAAGGTRRAVHLAARPPRGDRRRAGRPGRDRGRPDLRRSDRHLRRTRPRHGGHAGRDARAHPAGRRRPGRWHRRRPGRHPVARSGPGRHRRPGSHRRRGRAVQRARAVR